ncbi:hypothetical protein CQW23_25483 [Capsicum baccatum]|uniref:Uncharacterized protein n=1 Tax=Capsicum baccatum TaxID=33114 RepID=A0A2G2VL45_CAPBA|nr:hypothetical protein CQW23_25483 [Capsicum baccatum]
MHNVEMMDADKEPAAGEEKLSLPKSDLDDIKSYVKTYESEEDLHNTDEDLSKAITLYVPPSPPAYPIGIIDSVVAAIDTCDLQGNTYSQSYISDSFIAATSQFDLEKHHTIYASLLWDYGVNKAYTGYVSDNQDLPRPKRTFIPPENTEMIHVEP